MFFAGKFFAGMFFAGNLVFRRKIFLCRKFFPAKNSLPESFSGEKQFARNYFPTNEKLFKTQKIVNGQNILVIGHKLTLIRTIISYP